jgi:hypothetical protein
MKVFRWRHESKEAVVAVVVVAVVVVVVAAVVRSHGVAELI